MKFFRTEIKVDVLSEGPLEFDTLHELHNLIMNGPHSGIIVVESQRELTFGQLIDECETHNTDPEFFLDISNPEVQIFAIREAMDRMPYVDNIEQDALQAILDKLETEIEK